MKSIILAAGYGTRLGEVGETTPKGLLKYRGVELISKVIFDLIDNGITDNAVITNAKYYDAYKQWSDNHNKNIQIVNDNTTAPENRLGALGDLKFAIEYLGWENEDIIVSPSDTLFEFPLKTFFGTISQNPDQFATIVRKMDIEEIKNRLGCATLSEDNKISGFFEKPDNPPSPYAAIPFYYYPKNSLEILNRYKNEGNNMDAPGSIIPWLLANNYTVNACVVEENTLDVGTPKELEILNSASSL